jgi:hypothetical protein
MQAWFVGLSITALSQAVCRLNGPMADILREFPLIADTICGCFKFGPAPFSFTLVVTAEDDGRLQCEVGGRELFAHIITHE